MLMLTHALPTGRTSSKSDPLPNLSCLPKLTETWSRIEKSSIFRIIGHETGASATNCGPLPSSGTGRCRHRELLKVNRYQKVLQPLVPTTKIPQRQSERECREVSWLVCGTNRVLAHRIGQLLMSRTSSTALSTTLWAEWNALAR